MTEDEKEFEEIYKTVMEKLDLHLPIKFYLDPDRLMKNAMRLNLKEEMDRLNSLLSEKDKKIEELEKSVKGGCFNVLCYIEKVQSDKRIKSLEDGIEKHKEKNIFIKYLSYDVELYKLLEKKGE